MRIIAVCLGAIYFTFNLFPVFADVSPELPVVGEVVNNLWGALICPRSEQFEPVIQGARDPSGQGIHAAFENLMADEDDGCRKAGIDGWKVVSIVLEGGDFYDRSSRGCQVFHLAIIRLGMEDERLSIFFPYDRGRKGCESKP